MGKTVLRCDLLENIYLCGINNNDTVEDGIGIVL